MLFRSKQAYRKIFENRKAFFGGLDTEGAFNRLEELRTAFYNISSVRSQLSEKSKEIRFALNGRTFSQIEAAMESFGDLRVPDEADKNEIAAEIRSTERDIDGYKRELDLLRSEIIRLRTEMEQAFRDKPELSQIDESIIRIKREIDILSVRTRSIDIARDVLREAFEEMQKTFAPIVNERTSYIFSQLTCGKYKELSVSKELSVIVRDPSGNMTFDWKFLSSGTADQLYFALRLAIAEIFSERAGGLPLFLDDPFMQYDDERSIGAAEFMKEYAARKDSQILLFTCHNSTLQDFITIPAVYL